MNWLLGHKLLVRGKLNLGSTVFLCLANEYGLNCPLWNFAEMNGGRHLLLIHRKWVYLNLNFGSSVQFE